jgi:hypothetical protein
MGHGYERANCEKYRSFMTPVLQPCFASSFAKSAPPCLRDPHPRYLDRARTHRHPLGICCREPGMDQLGHLLNCEAARKHNRLGATVRAGGEQFKRPTAVGLGAAPGALCRLFGVRGRQRRHSVLTQVERGVFPSRPLPSTTRLAYGGERGMRTVNLAVGPSIRRPIPGAWPTSESASMGSTLAEERNASRFRQATEIRVRRRVRHDYRSCAEPRRLV